MCGVYLLFGVLLLVSFTVKNLMNSFHHHPQFLPSIGAESDFFDLLQNIIWIYMLHNKIILSLSIIFVRNDVFLLDIDLFIYKNYSLYCCPHFDTKMYKYIYI